MSTLSSSAQRVSDFLESKGHSLKVTELPDTTRTAQDAANALNCKVAQIAKSIIFKDENDNPILVIASGSNLIDVDKIMKLTGLKLFKANGKFVKNSTGYAIGGIPPVAHTQKIKTFLDPDLKQYDLIWAAAGTPHAVFSLTTEELAQLTQGEYIELAQEQGS